MEFCSLTIENLRVETDQTVVAYAKFLLEAQKLSLEIEVSFLHFVFGAYVSRVNKVRLYYLVFCFA